MSRFEDLPSEDEMAVCSFDPGASPQRWEPRVSGPAPDRRSGVPEAALAPQTEMQVLQQQITAAETTGEELAAEAPGAFDRRQGPRRLSAAECAAERRAVRDRRKRHLGLAGLLGAILSDASPYALGPDELTDSV